jgi:hypothetical protein
LADLCFRGGKIAGTLVASLFPEDEGDNPDFQPPDFEEIMRNFFDGLKM